MRVALYAKDVDDKQIAELRAWVVSQGFKDIIEYRDVTPLRGRSGDKELKRLIRDAEQHKFNSLFIISLKNIDSEYPVSFLILILGLKERGVRLISRAESWTDLSDVELGITYYAYCQHQDSEAYEMSRSSKPRRSRVLKKNKPKKVNGERTIRQASSRRRNWVVYLREAIAEFLRNKLNKKRFHHG